MLSAWLRVSTSSLRFLSSAAYCSASLTRWLISSSVRLVLEVMVTFCSLPVPRSLAETFTMPLRVDVERDLDLRHAARRRRNAGELEAAEGLVAGRHLALALQHVHLNGGLAVRRGGEDLALRGRDGGVAVDQAGEHAAHRLNAQRQRGDVQQQHVLDVAAENAALNRGADGHALVGVDAACTAPCRSSCWTSLLHRRNTGRAADQKHAWSISLAVRPASRSACSASGRRSLRTRSRVSSSNFARVRVISRCFGPVASAVMNGRLMLVLHHAGKLDLRLLRRLLEALQRHTCRPSGRCCFPS